MDLIQQRHRCILTLADRHPRIANSDEKYRVLIRRSKRKNLSVDDFRLVRFGEEFRLAFESGLYGDQGMFKDLILQAKKEIE